MGASKISLCVIARDEESFIERCLASAAGAVDEMVVVDTGSVDATPEIARRLGARVLHLPWDDDFSSAWNYCLDQARGDWALVMAADEELAAGSAERIRELTRLEADVFLLRVVVPTHGGGGVSEEAFEAIRLFRRLPGVGYKGLVHEYLELPENARVLRADVEIRDLGSRLDPERKLKKLERNVRILRRELEKTPHDPYLLFHLGNEEANRQDWSQAHEAYSAAEGALRAREETPDFRRYLRRGLALSLIHVERQKEAVKVLAEVVAGDPKYVDFHYLLGWAYLDLGDADLAQASFEECLRLGEPKEGATSWRGSGSYEAQAGLGVAFRLLDRLDEARTAFEKALKGNPRDAFSLGELVDVVRQLGEEPCAESFGRLVDIADDQIKAVLQEKKLV